jgi:hypothetical protein
LDSLGSAQESPDRLDPTDHTLPLAQEKIESQKKRQKNAFNMPDYHKDRPVPNTLRD